METLTGIILAVLASLVGIGLGFFGFYLIWNKVSGGRMDRARQQAESLVSDARKEESRVVQDARNEASKIIRAGQTQANEARDEIRERRRELQQAGQRLSNREDNLEKRGRYLARREGELEQRDLDSASIQVELSEAKQQQIKKLEVIADLTVSDAQTELMRQAEEDMQHEIAVRYRDLEEEARSQADDNAREIIGEAVQRLASDVISEATITNVAIPSDEMKGRLIGREGRNIRAIEKATGVDLIIDDTPEKVTVSCFDPIRREVARLALTKLISDGRIHPARIEDVVAKTQKDLQETIRKTGDSTVMDVGVRGLNKEMVTLLGRLKYRFISLDI